MDDDNTPFLCIPFASFEFIDTFDVMTITSDIIFSNTYLSFMVNENDPSYNMGIYSVLGSFTVSTECITQITDNYSYGNTMNHFVGTITIPGIFYFFMLSCAIFIIIIYTAYQPTYTPSEWPTPQPTQIPSNDPTNDPTFLPSYVMYYIVYV